MQMYSPAHLQTSQPLPRRWLAAGRVTVLRKTPDTFSTPCLCASRTASLSRAEPNRAGAAGPTTRGRKRRRIRRSVYQRVWEETVYILLNLEVYLIHYSFKSSNWQRYTSIHFRFARVCSFYAFACTRADLWHSRPEERPVRQSTAERRRRRHGETEGLLPGPKHPLPLWRGRYFDTTERGEHTSSQSITADTSDVIGYWLFHWSPPAPLQILLCSSALSNLRLLSGWRRASVRAHCVPLTSYAVLVFVRYFLLLLLFTHTVLQRHMGQERGGEGGCVVCNLVMYRPFGVWWPIYVLQKHMEAVLILSPHVSCN